MAERHHKGARVRMTVLGFFRSASDLHTLATDSAKGHGRVCRAGRDEVDVPAWIRPAISDNAFTGINDLKMGGRES